MALFFFHRYLRKESSASFILPKHIPMENLDLLLLPGCNASPCSMFNHSTKNKCGVVITLKPMKTTLMINDVVSDGRKAVKS